MDLGHKGHFWNFHICPTSGELCSVDFSFVFWIFDTSSTPGGLSIVEWKKFWPFRSLFLRAYCPNTYSVYDIPVSIWGRVTTFKLRFWMTFVGHFRECVKRTSLFYEMHQFFSKSTSRQNNVILFFYCSNLRICFVFCYTICSDFIKLSACKGFATLIDMSYGSAILLFRWLFSA